MVTLRLCGALASAVLCGCAWVLPKPAAAGSAALAPGAESRCRLDLSAARQAALDHVGAAGTPVPVIIARAGGPSTDRLIRNGARVTLGDIAATTQPQSSSAMETGPMTITAAPTGGADADSVPILDGAVIRLRALDAGHALGTVRQRIAPPAGAELVISKADAPDPNRPTTCDANLRDGDFVYLRTLAPSAWIGIHDRGLGSSAASGSSPEPCANHDERCYTDRYGGLLCARFSACATLSAR